MFAGVRQSLVDNVGDCEILVKKDMEKIEDPPIEVKRADPEDFVQD